MNETTALISLLDPSPIYDYGYELATFVYMTVTPTLLILAIMFRTMETQLDVLAGEGRWAHALRAFGGWSVVITLYFGLAGLVSELMNAMYSWIAQVGSMRAISQALSHMVELLKERASEQAAQEGTLSTVLDNLVALPSTAIALLFYYGSLVIVVAVHVFLKVAHAIGYSVGIAFGLIAIPLAITQSLRLLRGWGVFMGFLLLWPIIEGFALALFTPLFNNAARSLAENPDISVSAAASGAYTFFTVLNLVVLAIMIAAPFVAGALAANSPAHAGLVAPFIGSGVAAVAAMFKGRSMASSFGGGTLPGAPGGGSPPAGAGLDGARAQTAPQPRATSSAGSIGAGTGGGAGAGPESQAADSTSEAAPSSEENTQRARQQRRGVIITQQRKRRTE